MFAPEEKVVYPGHGVARILRIVTKSIAGKSAHFFELRFLNGDMTILVPVDNAENVGIRKLSSHEYVENLFKVLSEPLKPAQAVNWNRRNKGYLGKIRSGDLMDIGSIYRDLKHIEMNKKELSFGERNLLLKTEEMLVEEIALVENLPKEKAIKYIESLLHSAQK